MSDFITIDELLADPEPIDIPAGKRVKDKKSGDMVDAMLRFYPRRPNDIEKELAMGAANAARRHLRKELQDEGNEKRQLLVIDALEDADPESLRRIWVSGQMLERAANLNMNSLEEREYVPEPEGEIVLPEERDQYDEAVQASEKDRTKNLIVALEAMQRELNAESEALPASTLIESAIPAHIETILARTWHNTYTAHLISRCFYADPKYKKQAFKTVSQVDELRSQKPGIYNRLAETIRGLLMDLEPQLGN